MHNEYILILFPGKSNVYLPSHGRNVVYYMYA